MLVVRYVVTMQWRTLSVKRRCRGLHIFAVLVSTKNDPPSYFTYYWSSRSAGNVYYSTTTTTATTTIMFKIDSRHEMENKPASLRLLSVAGLDWLVDHGHGIKSYKTEYFATMTELKVLIVPCRVMQHQCYADWSRRVPEKGEKKKAALQVSSGSALCIALCCDDPFLCVGYLVPTT